VDLLNILFIVLPTNTDERVRIDIYISATGVEEKMPQDTNKDTG